MESHVVRVVPLIRLPALKCQFDYRIDAVQNPVVGQLVHISFRRKKHLGIIVELPLKTDVPQEKLLTATIANQFPILSMKDCAFARVAAAQFGSAESEIFRRIIPPLGQATIKQIQFASGAPAKQPCLGMQRPPKFHWYKDPAIMEYILEHLIKKIYPAPCLIIASTHEQAEKLCRVLKQYHPIHYIPSHTKLRRAAWSAWKSETLRTVIVSTHSGVWLPLSTRGAVIMIDPTHPAHEQWDGASYNNRAVMELRAKFEPEQCHYILHTPSCYDYQQYDNAPPLQLWPTRIDISTLSGMERLRAAYELISHHYNESNSVCVLVPHLHAALRLFCGDCHIVTDAPRDGTVPACTRCGSTHIHSYGLGGRALARVLEKNYYIPASDIVLHDRATPQLARLTIMTSAAADYTSLTSFHTIIDCATDFESHSAGADAEERAITRLRRLSIALSPSWSGNWIAFTSYPERLLWGTLTPRGLTTWWRSEESMRRKFKQPPFDIS